MPTSVPDPVSDSAVSGARQRKHRGFTLIELVITMIVVGILAVVVLPRFADLNVFETAGTADQLNALINHARKTAVAQRRLLYLDFAAVPPQMCPSASATLCVVNAACATTAAVPLPAGYRQPKTSVTLAGTLGTKLCFDALGRPYDTSGLLTAPKTVTVKDKTGAIVKTIQVENETGYVH